MIKIIAGAKGTGKTAKLVEDINSVAVEDNNVVCIERGNRLDQLLNHNVRLINITEYPCSGFDQLLSFIGGICSKDYDLTHIFIDSIKKVASCEDFDLLKEFLIKLDSFLADKNINVTLIMTCDVDSLPDEIKQFC